ncbi:YqgE/AlgH family protein [Spectribacter hydrogenooxidans]|uniref:YqgE/AlgH family protein n=1 Tax=Spectribacter hydrogenoxidans TaxID=3075608 RepID=A0ABU3BZA4_9GAMM|nr:YqgE/AlgH family protein [Salinisphaera sp. W335]MDT0634444.1 YqgE/AlgH family protein [Salinisphaera sp. W335]
MLFNNGFRDFWYIIAVVFVIGLGSGRAAAEPLAPSSSLQGTFLVAAPGSRGPFQETAVLVIGHDEDGAAGVVVNRETGRTLADIMDDPSTDNAARYDILSGGPVRPRALSLLQRNESGDDLPGMRIVTTTMAYTINAESIDAVLAQSPPADEIRLFAGYTAWDAGQLEREIASGAWLITTAEATDVFETAPDSLWHSLMERITGRTGPASQEGRDL